MAYIRIFLAVAFLVYVSAQLVSQGTCPTVTGQANLDPSKLLGYWFQFSSYPNKIITGECVVVTLSDLGFGVTSKDVVRIVNGAEEFSHGFYVNDQDNPSNLWSFIDGEFSDDIILSTDYYNYTITYNCKQNGGNKEETVVVLIRREYYKDEFEALVRGVINSTSLINVTALVDYFYAFC